MDNEALGTGWAFPPRFEKSMSNVVMSSGEEDIRQSLEIIIGTKTMDRFIHPYFGCDLSPFQFDSVGMDTELKIKNLITNAIAAYEPRVSLESVSLDTSSLLDGILAVSVAYAIVGTDMSDQLTTTIKL